MQIITRAEARASGLKRYFTGNSCTNGHTSERTTSDGQCTTCCLEKMRSRRVISKREFAAKSAAKFSAELLGAKSALAGRKRADGYLVSRRIARSLGMETYFPGTSCSNGHVSDRYVCSGNCTVCSNQFHKDRYAANKEEYAIEHLEWRTKNPEYRKKYRARNPDLYRIWDSRSGAMRRVRKSGGASSTEVKKWLSSQQKICYWCGLHCKRGYHIDHYVPLSRGGKHEIHNLVIACPRCNLKKNAKDPYEFAASVGRLF